MCDRYFHRMCLGENLTLFRTERCRFHSIYCFLAFSGHRTGMQVDNSILVVEQKNLATKIVNVYIAYDLDNCRKISLSNFKL